MKKLLLLTLCVIMSLFALVSCDEDILTEAKDQFDIIFGNYTPVVIEDAALDLYIITDEATQDNAITTVNDKINQYLGDRKNKKFNSKIEIHYYTESQYREAVDQIDSGIVLIAGKTMLDEYVAANKLCDLAPYLSDTSLIKKYGFATLNASINKLLLEVAHTDDGKLYFVPNNHVIGSYSYIIIDKSIARDKLNFNLTKLSSMTTVESTAELKDAVTSNSTQLGGVTADDVVKVINNATYADKAKYESEGYICNVLSNPVVDEEEAAIAGFGILAGTTNVDAAMEFIYALNSEETLRNLLQYGVEYTNYVMENGIARPVTSGDSVYKMNLVYTGDIFLAHCCETEGWYRFGTSEKANGLLQNKDAYVFVEESGSGEDAGEGEGGAGEDSGS